MPAAGVRGCSRLRAMDSRDDDPAVTTAAPSSETTIDTFLRGVAAISAAPASGLVAGDAMRGAERYVDDVEIARGGMGKILAAYDRELGRPVAIKVLLRAGLRARFARETRLTARLQHPAIVSLLDAGTWRGGEPYYAMQLVPGRSLDQVIAAAATSAARLALVPHVQAVADALAYAHEQRIVHRDLKPHNVLVGAFGETVVIDWGLAKILGEVEPREGDGDGGDRDAAMTAAGDVLGTPAYMAPEQAAGDAVDARADVYAIGALAYHVLTGAPPYQGKSSREVLEAVQREPPAPLPSREPGLPADLVAIVARAMARDPGERYRDAGALASDLRRFAAGQLVGAHRYSAGELVRRWVRRHRGAVAVGAIAIAALAVIGALSVRRIVAEEARADDERRVAVRSRADAEELMDFMLGDLRQRLDAVGKLDLLDAVATKARAYYAARPDDGTPEGQHRRALALRNLGKVVAARGDARGALALYREAIAIVAPLAAAEPARTDLQIDLAELRYNAASEVQDLGDHAAGLAELEAARDQVGRAVARQAAPGLLRVQVTLQHAIGMAHVAQGDLVAAIADEREAVRVGEALVAAEPSDENRGRLVLAYQNLGTHQLTNGDTAGAIASDRAAVERAAALVAADGADATRQYRLLLTRTQLGKALYAQGDPAAALTEFRTAVAIGEQLALRDPSNSLWLEDLAHVQSRYGRVLAEQGDHAGGLAAARAALARRELLTARDPASIYWRQDVAASHMDVSQILAAHGDLDAATAEERAALAMDEQVAATAPGNGTWQREVAVHHLNLGQIQLDRHEVVDAIAEARAAVAIFASLIRDQHDNVDWVRLHAGSQLVLAMALTAHHELGAASAASAVAVDGYDRLAAADPTNAELASERLDAWTARAAVLGAQRDAGAADALRTMVQLADQLAAQAATDPDALGKATTAYLTAGTGLDALGNAGAREAFRKGLALAERIAAGKPGPWADAAATFRRHLGPRTSGVQ
ncbi:MAG: serine/threonine protein kinase [Deltaproteobacteria bacterium]|nr:serine/threonine protein kinase [Deltaproteobacteria bacterium]